MIWTKTVMRDIGRPEPTGGKLVQNPPSGIREKSAKQQFEQGTCGVRSVPGKRPLKPPGGDPPPGGYEKGSPSPSPAHRKRKQ